MFEVAGVRKCSQKRTQKQSKMSCKLFSIFCFFLVDHKCYHKTAEHVKDVLKHSLNDKPSLKTT